MSKATSRDRGGALERTRRCNGFRTVGCLAECGAGSAARPVNAMSVDVEDYFQVQAFADVISRGAWDALPCRVEANVDRLLALFGEAGVKATFFTLGWVAERHPALIRRIVSEGHELASHGWDHTRADAQDEPTFRADIRRTRQLLEDIGQTPVVGYRAATFSIGPKNRWAFRVLAEEGHRYSSSLYPIRHDLYGDVTRPARPSIPRRAGAARGADDHGTMVRTQFPVLGWRLFPVAALWRLAAQHAAREPT